MAAPAAVYSRLSRDRSGLSPNCQIQTDEARDYAEGCGYEVVAEYQENDVSASKYSTKPRPFYDQLLERIRANEIEVVLATEMTRLYRQLPQLLELIKLAETTSLKRIETTEGQVFLLHTGEGIHAAISSVNNAMLESRKISDRGKRKKRAQAKDGVPAGGPRPFGYQSGGMLINPDEAIIFHELEDRLLAGEGTGSLIMYLRGRGIKTTMGNDWTRPGLAALLTRKRNIGIRIHGDDEYPAKWEPLTTKDRFDAVALELRSRYAVKKQHGDVRRYLLTGFAYCGLCGNKLTCSRKRRDPSRPLIPTYTCRKLDANYDLKGCDKISRNGLALEDFVTEAILYRLDGDGLAAALSGMTEDKALIGSLMGEVETRSRKLDELAEMLGSGEMTRQQYAKARGTATDALETAQSRLNKEMQSRTVVSLPTTQSLREAWETSDLEWKRGLMSLMIGRVVVHPQLKRPYYKTLGRFDPDAISIEWLR